MFIVLVGDNDIDYMAAYGPYDTEPEAIQAAELWTDSDASHEDDGEEIARTTFVLSHQDLLNRIAEES